MERVHILIKGHVQGVAFRAYTQMEARRLHLCGYVRNLPDRTVEIVAEGEKKPLEKLVEWAHQGSPVSQVDEVSETFSTAAEEFNSFMIKY